MSKTGIGAPVRRLEDHRFITGAGNYTDDVNIAGQAYAAFARSEHAHASVRKVDASKAMKVAGVVAVFTGADLEKDAIGPLPAGWMIHSKDGSPMNAPGHPCLVQGKARYVGDPIAVVIGETQAAARAGAEALEIDYDVHEAVTDMMKTASSPIQLHDGAPKNTCYEWELGDKAATAAAFKQAKHVTKLQIINNRLVPNAMEPRSAVGDYDSGTGVSTVYTTSQNPHVARLVMSAFLNVAPEHKLRVIAPDVGGGFGSKIYVYPEEVVCTWAAKKVGRAVKWTAERTESFITDAHGRDHVTTAELATDERGKILALRVHTTANLGAYPSLFATCVPTYLYATLLSGQYDIPAIYAEVDAVYTNTVPVD
ncbi:MAG: xanthine dehydrogenase family protein molybdopterin-binding subunit, partial [Rhodobiaceae bacterium]|nr:xanthine dehydrogenase family protein molybdopterin-binding subunit [Rhodobiaceae bacterium]